MIVASVLRYAESVSFDISFDVSFDVSYRVLLQALWRLINDVLITTIVARVCSVAIDDHLTTPDDRRFNGARRSSKDNRITRIQTVHRLSAACSLRAFINRVHGLLYPERWLRCGIPASCTFVAMWRDQTASLMVDSVTDDRGSELSYVERCVCLSANRAVLN